MEANGENVALLLEWSMHLQYLQMYHRRRRDLNLQPSVHGVQKVGVEQ